MRGRTALFAALLFPLWMAAALGVAEVAFRAFVRPPRQIIAHDTKLGWRYLPHVNAVTREGERLTTNSLGFRGAETDAPTPAGQSKVLVLGDSYTAGMHVADDQIFTSLLGKASLAVRNGAAPAWATDQELLYFETEGVRFKPDLVLLAVVPNDIRESYAKGFFHLSQNGDLTGGEANVQLSMFDRLTWALLNQSALAQWLGDKFGFLDVFRLLSRYYRFSFLVEGREATDFELFLKHEPEEVQKARHLFEALVRRLHARCKEANAKLVVTVLPTLMEFSWPLIGSKDHQAGIVSQRVSAFARKEKIEFVDLLTPALDSGGDARTLFLEGDFHFNRTGHAFVARELARALGRPLK